MRRRKSGLAKRQRSGLEVAKRRFVFSVTIPAALYASLGLFTLGWALVLMFFDYSPGRAGGPILGLGGSNPFVGLEHFGDMIERASLQARLFRISLKNTLIFAFAVLPLNLVITLPLAVLIESVRSWWKTAFRAVYFLPVVTASVGVALIWHYLYDPQAGFFNAVIRLLGGTPVAWLSDPRAEVLGVSVSMWAVIGAYLWADYGFNLVIFIAALQAIPSTFREAAVVDGANAWQVFTRVTIPLLRPTILFVCVMTMISSFQVFDIIQVMTEGGPNNQTRVLVLEIYQNAFRYQRMGWASAIAFVLVLIVMGITIVQMRLLRTEWEY